MALGDANTRDRDYGDIYVLSQIQPLQAVPLREALQRVAEHRGREVHQLAPLLVTLRENRQQPWQAYRARVALPGLPDRFAEVVDGVVQFVDGLQGDGVTRGAQLSAVGSDAPCAAANVPACRRWFALGPRVIQSQR